MAKYKGQERIVEADKGEPRRRRAEVVEEEATPVSTDSSQVLINMESMIKEYISSIAKLTQEAKEAKEMLEDIFKNDPTFQEHSKAAEEASRIKKNTKQEVLKRSEAKELNEKVKSLKSQLAENQASLSDYLGEYQRMSGVSEIEDNNGELYEIIYVAKLRKV